MEDRFYDSPQQKTAVFFDERFVAARYEEGCYEKHLLRICSCSRMTVDRSHVGVAKGTLFQEIRPWAGFKTGDFVKDKSGGLP